MALLKAAVNWTRSQTWIPILALVLALPVSHDCGKRSGYKLGTQDSERKSSVAVAQMEARYRERETTHEREVSQLRTQYIVDNAKENTKDAVVSRDYASGSKRLRFYVSRSCPKPAETITTTARVDDKTPAIVASETSEALYTIAADGDTAIRQLTALQEWVATALELCNGK